ncbi:GDT1-like protein 1, chloroplastic isoform X2 [Amborella trichopoda]|uniref:GDT1-like protein 1, chloroplastic isoform X2 n=1 Tax=Amborella trichopoda TaxID=13333 RepID=UPI0005D36ACB|nr:GDT1-like protein 1, chloroplastic isoform X2 [Amborella trichopoda]|eukprot:XP_020530637.1 GDT1-like protein 1, chloroplastic isoform X2 [Amborella trichopoda]
MVPSLAMSHSPFCRFHVVPLNATPPSSSPAFHCLRSDKTLKPHSPTFNTALARRISRYLKKWPLYVRTNAEVLEVFQLTSSTSHNDLGFVDDKMNCLDVSSELMHVQYNSDHLDKCVGASLVAKDGKISTPFVDGVDNAAEISFSSWMKFAMLFGFSTLQYSPYAMATLQFASGLQSIPYIGDFSDVTTGFTSAFLLIFFSELGDKTFFIAALLAARNSAAIVFVGTFGALAAMTIISVFLGRTFHYIDGILPFRLGETELPIDDILAVCLLVYFGFSTLREAISSDSMKTKDEQEEAELAVSEFSRDGAGIVAAANTAFGTFFLVFVAEWGDKSFFSTIALAAASSPLGVVFGALAGHAAATLLAVLGGSLLGTFLSEKALKSTLQIRVLAH